MNISKIKGLSTELECQLYFTKLGLIVSKPLGEDSPYDFILDVDGKLIKVQAKTSHEDSNGIIFRTKSSYLTSKGTVQKQYSSKDVDFFATSYKGNCYLIPISQTGSSEKKLLFDGETQKNGCSFLSDYLGELIITLIKEDKPMPNENRFEILQYDLNNHFIKSFSSPKEAAKALGKTQSSHITACANGSRKTAYGYIWKYNK